MKTFDIKKIFILVSTLYSLSACTDRLTMSEPGSAFHKPKQTPIAENIQQSIQVIDPGQDNIRYQSTFSCSRDRLYLESDLKTVSSLFRLPRRQEQNNENIPKSCVYFAMEQFPDLEQMYSTCSSQSSKPESGAKKPCLTSNYVNSVYNSFVDVMSCLKIDQKIFVPKLLNESGFHINALNSRGFDAGVGQLTRAPIEDINSNHRFNRLMNLIKDSPSDACQRIASVPGALDRAQEDAKNRCTVIKPGLNPLRNLVYTGLLTIRQKEIVEYYFEKHQIEKLMNNAGLADFDKEKLIESLSILAYNAGGGTAVNYLKNYLEVRIEKMSQSARGLLSVDDFNFNLNIEETLAKRSELLSHFRKAKEEGISDFADVALKRIENEAQEFGIENMSFPEFLVHFQTIGSRGYNTFLADNKRKLDETFRGGECTPEKFLSL